MSTMALRIASTAVLAILAGACTDAPTTPTRDPLAPTVAALTASATTGAERVIQEALYDYTGSVVQYPCGLNGETEWILMEGKLYERYTTTSDGAGGLHALTHSMPVGLRGVGLTTGAEYRISERDQGTFNQGAMGQTAGTYQDFLTIAAPELGLRGRLTVGGTFVINANGELILERPILRADCETE